ncbi:transposase [Endozoicomonas sp. ONNA1]|uniref:transposase n=1 Tax=unclassified Endozoicomonas TaxID=2644528 RepID=UPI0034D2620E
MGQQTDLSLIDSMPIVVCDNHRINSRKVFLEEAKLGVTSTGWKFGFKPRQNHECACSARTSAR